MPSYGNAKESENKHVGLGEIKIRCRISLHDLNEKMIYVNLHKSHLISVLICNEN